jgi:hypothetical protein
MKNASIRTTVCLAPGLYRAARVRAAETGRSFSKLINEAVKLSLAEDALDLAAFDERAAEPDLPFAEVVRGLSSRGRR